MYIHLNEYIVVLLFAPKSLLRIVLVFLGKKKMWMCCILIPKLLKYYIICKKLFTVKVLSHYMLFSYTQEVRGTLGCLLHYSQSFIITFCLWLYIYNLGDCYWILIGWFIKLGVQTFQALIVTYTRGNFVYYHYYGCASDIAISL